MTFLNSHLSPCRETNAEGLMIEEYDALKRTIERDCRVLESFRIMDYSMLLGVHNLDRARADSVHFPCRK